MRVFKSIKFRLTVWYLVVIVVLMLGFGILAYFMMSYNLYNNQDDFLRNRMAELQTELQVDSNSQIQFSDRPADMVMVFDSNYDLVQSLGPNVQFMNIATLVKRASLGQTQFQDAMTADNQKVRLLAAPANLNTSTRVIIIVGRSPADIEETLGTFRKILGFSGLAITIFAAASGVFLSNRVLKPVDKINQAAHEIGESDLSRRIEINSEDELGRLSGTLNGMFQRLESAFNRQRQFTADASHELRTPLAIIQAESTLALEKGRSEQEYLKSLETVAQESAFMSTILEKLLFLARIDAGREPYSFQEINLHDLLDELSQDMDVLAKEKGLTFTSGRTEDLKVIGDKTKLRQLFLNILGNAISYTPTGGTVSYDIYPQKEAAVVAISDTGIGIPPEHIPFLFERFYRVDKTRSRSEGGSCLGLSIADKIAEAHGGKIEVDSKVGQGSTFRISLPLSDLNQREKKEVRRGFFNKSPAL
jgi:heavy metal sensor kinase